MVHMVGCTIDVQLTNMDGNQMVFHAPNIAHSRQATSEVRKHWCVPTTINWSHFHII